jgi:hypothetical protein
MKTAISILALAGFFGIFATLASGSPLLLSEAKAESSPPRAAWEHAKKEMVGNTDVKIVKESPTHLELLIKDGGEKISYVFVLAGVRGDTATVFAGLKDAGADTIYELAKRDGAWVVVIVEHTSF